MFDLIFVSGKLRNRCLSVCSKPKQIVRLAGELRGFKEKDNENKLT